LLLLRGRYSFRRLKIPSGIVLMTNMIHRQMESTYTVLRFFLMALLIVFATFFGVAVSGPGVERSSIIFVLTNPGFTVIT
jgi:hypothetical protein